MTWEDGLFTRVWQSGTQRLIISVYICEDGGTRLQISRESKSIEGDFRLAKLGRFSKKEAEGIIPIIQEALSIMR